MKQPVTARHRRLCRRYFQRLIKPLRARAMELGYAIGVHGSLERDIDLIAVPWTGQAVAAKDLAYSLKEVVQRVHGYAFEKDKEGCASPEYFTDGSPGHKPHGRLVWTFHLGGGPYIDLAVMPREQDLSDCQFQIRVLKNQLVAAGV